MDKMFGGLSLHHHMTNFETVVGWQGRIQDFHLGGGGRKRICVSTHITSAEPNSLSAGGPGPA